MKRFLLGAVLGMLAVAAPARADKVLKVVPANDIVLLDPVFGTAWISMVGGVMIYESLFTWDAQMQPRPMMVASWTTSPDGLTWRFTLRDGQTFHDGAAVTTNDVVASLKRWMGFDGGGAKLAAAMTAMAAVDATTFEIRLQRPFPAMLSVLAAAPARFAAIMRAQDIPSERKPVTNGIGSGPFRYVAAERISGARLVYERNPAYVPRAEPPDGMAGGRVVKVDRVEWHIIPDAATVAAALQSGEMDMAERPSFDVLPLLAKAPGVKLQKLSALADQTILRPNHLQPPFNDVRARRALNYLLDQGDAMAAGFGDPGNWQRCNAFFTCGGPYESEAGAEGFKPDLAKAKALLAEAGYKGEKLVFIASHDNVNGVISEVVADAMAKAGMNVEMVWSDWATVVGRALKQDPPSQGGWNIRVTGQPGALAASPQANAAIDTSCTRRNFSGWPCDEEAETLRAALIEAAPAARPALLEKLHRRLAEVVPYRVLGQSSGPAAFRTNITGVLSSPVIVYWNIEKN
jgi:peptide/nickel transport system substrate-binding protein